MLFLILCGLVPSAVILLCLHFTADLGELAWFALGFNATCSLIAGIGLVGRERDLLVRIFFGSIMAAALFVFNAFVVIAVGCSGMGRIAP